MPPLSSPGSSNTPCESTGVTSVCVPENKGVGIERFTGYGWCHGNKTFKISLHSVVFETSFSYLNRIAKFDAKFFQSNQIW